MTTYIWSYFNELNAWPCHKFSLVVKNNTKSIVDFGNIIYAGKFVISRVSIVLNFI